MNQVKIVLADHHELLTDVMKAYLNRRKGLKVLYTVNSGDQLLDSLQSNVNEHPDLIIMEISMPGLNGIWTVFELKKKYPSIRVMVFTSVKNKNTKHYTLLAGADAYLHKTVTSKVLLSAIKEVANNTYELPKSDALALNSNEAENNNLSRQELQVLMGICEGLRNPEIAESLYRSERTIEGIRRKIYKKTNTKSPVSMVKYAVNEKLLFISYRKA